MSDAAPRSAANRPEPTAIDRLQHAVESHPHDIFLAGHELTYAEAWARTGGVAAWLIAQGLGPQSAPVAILSESSLERALFFFGALRAGVPVASLLPDYSLSGDFARLDHALEAAQPALVFAQDSRAYSAALDRAQARGARIVTVDGKRGLAFAALATCSIDAAVAERRLHITADTPARIQFMGSTTAPNGVLSSHKEVAEEYNLGEIYL